MNDLNDLDYKDLFFDAVNMMAHIARAAGFDPTDPTVEPPTVVARVENLRADRATARRLLPPRYVAADGSILDPERCTPHAPDCAECGRGRAHDEGCLGLRATPAEEVVMLRAEVERLTAQVEAERAERDEAERLQRVDEGTLTHVHEILAPLFPAPGYREPRPTTADLAVLLVERLKAQEQALGGVLAEVAAERARQIGKGYTAEHDDQHTTFEISAVAAAVALGARDQIAGDVPEWADHIIEKHGTYRRLIIATALFVAEAERLKRLQARKASTPEMDCF